MTEHPLKALLVEDENATRELLAGILAGQGHAATTCTDGQAGWEAYQRENPDLVLLDWMMPGVDGLELCRRIRASLHGDGCVVLLLTSRTAPQDLQAVLDAGADDYLPKPVNAEMLKIRLAIAERRVRDRLERRRAQEAVRDLRRQLDEKARFHELVGKSKAMLLVYQQIQALARVDSTVLIEGETGTGKELVARAIHNAGHRRDKPFVPVNTAGLTESLMSSQLFGHRRGAFTGAIDDHKGFFETANGGTVLLDEIGDIPPPVQTMMLRVLQEREILRLGESKPRKVNVRVLAATHRNLSEEVSKGNFRADLLYRIRVARIRLPALRERREDIPLLAASFLTELRAANDYEAEEIGHEAVRRMLDYAWPGNVRELRSAIEFAAIRCAGPIIQAEDLPPEVLEGNVPGGGPGNPFPNEKQRILAALESTRGKRAAAARLLGMSRTTFYRRLAELGIAAED